MAKLSAVTVLLLGVLSLALASPAFANDVGTYGGTSDSVGFTGKMPEPPKKPAPPSLPPEEIKQITPPAQIVSVPNGDVTVNTLPNTGDRSNSAYFVAASMFAALIALLTQSIFKKKSLANHF